MNVTQSQQYIAEKCSQYLRNNHSKMIEFQEKIITQQEIQAKLSQSNISNNNVLICVDRNMLHLEKFKYMFMHQQDVNFYIFNDETKAAQKVKENLKNNIVLISSVQSASHLSNQLKNTNINVLIFCCEENTKHRELFFQIKQIKGICDRFDKINNLYHKIMSEHQIKNNLQLLISAPITLETPEYQHSTYHVSFQFALVIQQLNFQLSMSEEKLFDEFSNLLKKNGYDKNEIQDSFQEINEIRKQAEIYKKKKLMLFEIFIIIYAADYYWYINSEFAKRNYNDIQCIIAVLYNGYQKQEVYNFKELYRGLSLNEKDFHNLKNVFEQSQNDQQSLTWNNLSSTSTDIKVVTTTFISSKPYSVIFKIYLNNQSPHPHYKIPIELAKYKKEKEVLLFPQFEFMVEDLKQTGKSLFVTIRQVDNKFCYIFDKDKREEYWQNNFNNKIYPQLDELISIIYIRFDQLRSLVLNLAMNSENQKRLKEEEYYCLKRIEDLISLFEGNMIIKKKILIVLKVLQTEIQKNETNYQDTNYVEKIKECVLQNCFQALGTQVVREEQIKQFVSLTYYKAIEKSNQQNHESINFKEIIEATWKNTYLSIFSTITKENQNLYAVKIKKGLMAKQIERYSPYTPLFLSCNYNCNCGCRSPSYWTHAQCGSILQINVDGNVFCEKQCQTVFIKNLNFICQLEGERVNKIRSLSDFLMNFTQGLKAGESQLSDPDLIQFTVQLSQNVMQKWHQ